MKESDFLSFKRELWEIIRSEGIVVTNQNLDWILQKSYDSLVKKTADEMLSDLCHSFSVGKIDLKAVAQKGKRNAE